MSQEILDIFLTKICVFQSVRANQSSILVKYAPKECKKKAYAGFITFEFIDVWSNQLSIINLHSFVCVLGSRWKVKSQSFFLKLFYNLSKIFYIALYLSFTKKIGQGFVNLCLNLSELRRFKFEYIGWLDFAYQFLSTSFFHPTAKYFIGLEYFLESCPWISIHSCTSDGMQEKSIWFQKEFNSLA